MCGAEVEEDWVCERCGEYICDECIVPFTYPSCVDFTICNTCHDIAELEMAREEFERDKRKREKEEEEKYQKEIEEWIREQSW